MATYAYEAITKSGTLTKGTQEAENIDQAKSAIKAQGMSIIEISEQSVLNRDLNIDFGGKPKARDMSVFCRQFVSMTKAGVSILDALKMLTEQTENEKLKKGVEGVRVSVEKGHTLADAFAEFPKVFPSLMINLVGAGEASGSLDNALERLSVQFESTAKVKALVKKAMIYPIVVMVVALGVVIAMLVKIIPSYTIMFEQLDTELPKITLAVKACSDFLLANWMILLPLLVGVVIFFIVFSQTDVGKHIFHKIQLVVPALKTLKIKQASSMFARTLSTLIAAGVPLVDAVQISSTVMENVYFKEALEACRDALVIGQPLSRPLEECGLFPPMVYHMTRIGEEAGNTEDMLTKLADYYDEEVEIEVQSFMAALEPMIIIVLACVVGVLVAACLAPMLTMYNALNNL